jgi:tRNA A-37 threonylcarbamoyl transferase component Bud32
MLPSGYERLLLGHAIAVARSDLAGNVRRSLISADGTKCTLYEYASRHPSARELRGRGAAYSVPLPQSTLRVVVRHNRHGGLLAPITRDRFIAPTRAPHELSVSMQLRALGVPTPEIVTYVLYPPGGLLQRADVASREIASSQDLAHVLMADADDARDAAIQSTARLLASLSRAGARHHDLNAKNVLLGTDSAYVLDVDRITMGTSLPAALEGNLARLKRSLRKWREQFGAHVSEVDLAKLESATRDALSG